MPEPESHDSNKAEDPSEILVSTGDWASKNVRPRQQEFPSVDAVVEPVRIAFTDQSHADVIAHSKTDLGRELCGVLLGTICEDSRGLWISVEAALRGDTDKQGGTHVTYTHETWQKIYAAKDKQFPKLSILGWYHTHPGFGVRFSEMDLFIQKNFFSGKTQFALVVDPIGGAEAVIANTSEGTRYVSNFWVGARRMTGCIPDDERSNEISRLGVGSTTNIESRLQEVEVRLAQVLQATSDAREASYRMFLFLGTIIAASILCLIGYFVYDSVIAKKDLPKSMQYVPVPIEIEGKPAVIGLRIESWELPEGSNLIEQRAREIAAELAEPKARDDAAD